MTQNYFKLLDVPQSLLLDHNELKKKYFLLVKENSHDPVLDKGKQNQKKLNILETAYETLSDRISRIQHLLETQGLTVANDNKAPNHFVEVDTALKEVLPKFQKEKSKFLDQIKSLHQQVISQFSAVSIDLANLEKAWDEDQSHSILKKLRRKSAAFNYIKNIEQDLREHLNR